MSLPELELSLFLQSPLLGPPVVPLVPIFGGLLNKIDYREQFFYPYSNLPTGGPRLIFRGRPSEDSPHRSCDSPKPWDGGVF